jgi:hypothetical protein
MTGLRYIAFRYVCKLTAVETINVRDSSYFRASVGIPKVECLSVPISKQSMTATASELEVLSKISRMRPIIVSPYKLCNEQQVMNR